MTYPNYPGKHTEDALVSARAAQDHLRDAGRYPSGSAPEAVILCYQRRVWDRARSEDTQVWFDGGFWEVRVLPGDAPLIGVAGGFGIGAPVACMVLEHLVAFGIRCFVSIGTAGALQKGLTVGDVVVCDRAVRDEGTSHHYLKTSRYAFAGKGITSRLVDTLEKRDVPYRVGASWTIDAAFRETAAEVSHYQREGVATVEMEASALFAVAEYHGVEMGAMLTISDTLVDAEWRPEFTSPATLAGLDTLYEVAVASLK